VKALETERLLLRRLKMDDVDDLLDIFSDPEAMRYYLATKDRREAEDWVRSTLVSYQKNGFGLWAAILKGSNEFAP
jgi:RimJ/RimL family protein N-acetyltransferase